MTSSFPSLTATTSSAVVAHGDAFDAAPSELELVFLVVRARVGFGSRVALPSASTTAFKDIPALEVHLRSLGPLDSRDYVEVKVLSAGTINGESLWSLERLEAVWHGIEHYRFHSEHVALLEMSGGKVYSLGANRLRAGHEKTQLWFRTPPLPQWLVE